MLLDYQRYFSNRHRSKELLTGLRPKGRARMLFALEQADIELLHSYAIHDDKLREADFLSKIQPIFEQLNKGLSALQEQAHTLSEQAREQLLAAFGPEFAYVVHREFFGRLNVTQQSTNMNYIMRALEQVNLTDERNLLWKRLSELREELLTPQDKSKYIVPDAEKAEIVARISAPKALPPGSPLEVPHEDSSDPNTEQR